MSDYSQGGTPEELIRHYRRFGDRELVRLCLEENDDEAAYYLITIRYRETLYKRMGTLWTHYTSDQLQDELHDFMVHMIERTGKGYKRLKSYNPDRSFAGWIASCYQNYYRDSLRRNKARGRMVDIDSLYGMESADEPDSPMQEPIPSSDREALIDAPLEESAKTVDPYDQQLILLLDLVGELSPRDQYILLTYLLCKRYERTSVPLRLSERIAEALRAAGYAGTNSKNIAKAFHDAKRRLQEKKKQIGM